LRRTRMSRALAACIAVCLAASPALAASPKVESAIKVFKAVAADANKLKTYCAMTKVMDAAADKEDPKLDAQIEGYMKQLGPDFVTAWNAAEGLDDNSADGKAYNTAVDDLSGKCT
jgi:hypothetical protein